MKSDDVLIALIAETDPVPPSASLGLMHRELADRVRQRVLEVGGSTRPTDPQRHAGRQRHVLRGVGNAVVVAVSMLVVVVVGGLALIAHTPAAKHAAGQHAAGQQMMFPVPSVGQVTAAMEHQQPFIVQGLYGPHGEQWGRVVLDVPSRYQAIYGNADDPAYAGDRGLPKGRLTLLALDKQGIEFRWTAAGCYRRDKAPSLNAQNLFGADLRGAHSPRSRLTPAAVVTYPGHDGTRLTVNVFTRLIQSAADPGLPSGGVPATHRTYTYPTSVKELPAPRACS